MLILIGLYSHYDPALSTYFPKCPIFSFTGIQCPGCGSQRAVHQLLQFQFSESFAFNPLVIIFLPYILLGWIAQVFKNYPAMELIRIRLYGVHAAYIILTIVVIFTIIRNIL